MSTPAVVFSLGFTYDWAIGGYDFLEYMDRPEAFDKTRHHLMKVNALVFQEECAGTLSQPYCF